MATVMPEISLDDLITEVSGNVTATEVADAQRTADFLASNPVAFGPVRMFALDTSK